MKHPFLLVLLLAGMAAFFGLQLQRAFHGPGLPALENRPASGAGRRPDIPDPGNSSPADPSLAVSAVSARPLFRMDRRPYRELPAAPPRNYDAELSRFKLAGIMANGGELSALVIIRSNSGTDRVELKNDDPLPGFVVKEVRGEGLYLESDNRRFFLPLYGGAPSAGQNARTEVRGTVPAANQKGSIPGRP